MKYILSPLAVFAWIAVSCTSVHADLIQVASGGTTSPSGSEDRIDVTLDTTAFASVGLWDAASSTVGGGSVDGDLYYAFIARPLNREGGANYIPNPPGAVGGLPTPSGARGGGVISRGSTDVLGVGDNTSAHAYSTFGALTGDADLSNRLDLSPNLPVTFLVHVDYNAKRRRYGERHRNDPLSHHGAHQEHQRRCLVRSVPIHVGRQQQRLGVLQRRLRHNSGRGPRSHS